MREQGMPAKRGRLWRTLGIILLVIWVIPNAILCIPQTGSYHQFEPTFAVVEYTYVPIVDIFTPPVRYITDYLALSVYFGIPILSIWLIRKGHNKTKIKQPGS